MEKKSFNFYQDVKVTIWQRQHFSIEADSREEAIAIAKGYSDSDVSFNDEVEVNEVEWLYDTEEWINPEENGGCATIEVYEIEGKHKANFVADNVKKIKLIGYQIDFEEEDWPADYFSFQVFRTKNDAEDYLFVTGSDDKYYDRIVEIYEGDIEEPTLIGTKIRKFEKNEEVMVDDGLHYYAAIVEAEVTIEGGDTMPVFPIGSDDKCLPPVDVDECSIYKKAPGKMCPECGKPLYVDHYEETRCVLFCTECEFES